ncbi:hypothetical protein P0W64_15195 [Tsukamurella sp. 8F]|uniref:hypothetical protein n=1 Tax=unclassified Tsukamurella TaxID=2633480 RepID=UPI0023BA3206|nr:MULTISPECIES: hypothetical protein [unclassified Tsukamurella]MDF0529127.1 hypothetical protein [Tsukamurella sp. 8J]MDF0588123.1 hypothetical protein [Tsukamurella sp. 8F]
MRRRSLIPAVALLGTALISSGCTVGDTGRVKPSLAASPSQATAPSDTLPSVARPSVSVPPPPPPSKLSEAFSTVAQGETVGVAFAPVGSGATGERAIVLGDDGDVAWSTSKVPLVIAALQRFGPSAQAQSQRAIEASDNAAAQALWDRFGGGDAAAQAVDRVLHDGGDTETGTQSEVTRPGYTAFGQTDWTYKDQAVFAAHLPCMPQAKTVLKLMGEVDANQRWGVQPVFPGAQVKGGWGPTVDGRYQVRQLAVIRTDRGEIGVSIGTVAASFEAGQQTLNRIGRWVRDHAAELPAGQCG